MRRMQVFEWEDQPWLPRVFRDFITDQLRFTHSEPMRAPVNEAIAQRVASVMARTNTTQIVDLCAGAGGPITQIGQILARDPSRPVHIVLTDLYPNVAAFEDVVGKNRDGTLANGYAALKELERLNRLDTQVPDANTPLTFHYDPRNKRKVQSPEYGGNGTAQGDCGGKAQPAVAFPAHWAPMATLFYTGTMFPARYRGGVFVAFHGSWNRAPRPQEGFRVAFAPFANGKATGQYEDFALPAGEPNGIRPSGLALGPDGSLYIGADREGKIWRVVAANGKP